MQTTFKSLMAIAGLLGLAGVAAAQSTYTPGGAVTTPTSSTAVVGGGWGIHNHSSTFEEGWYRGQADLNRSIGDTNYMNSLARINNQEAYSRWLNNQEQRTETYFRMKQINQAAREAMDADPLTPEQYAVLAKKQAPDRLDPQQYDRVVGRLNWPVQLKGDEYAEERAYLEKLFASRSATDVGVGSAFDADVRAITNVMRDKLQANLRTMSPMEFIAAKKFIDGVGREANQPFTVEAVAVR
jgi:hypothetical protein